jgi:AraC-like DNA-binding protein
MQLLIKNMVCDRCIRVVQEELNNIGLSISNIGLGYVELESNLDEINLALVQKTLHQAGFELINDSRIALVEEIKLLIINEIHSNIHQKLTSENFSDFLVKKLSNTHLTHEYSFISTLFSSIEKTTIEKYIIAQKIERTKELISYGELSLSEIAWDLGYSSVAYLSNQFKQIVGCSPSEYKKQNLKNRQPIDGINNLVTNK